MMINTCTTGKRITFVLSACLLVLSACGTHENDDRKQAHVGSADTVVTEAKPAIPPPDSTTLVLVDSVTKDFRGVWVGNPATGTASGAITICPDGKATYAIPGREALSMSFRTKQVWRSIRDAHIDFYYESHDPVTGFAGANLNEVEPGKIFATAELQASSRLSILWFDLEFVKSVRALHGLALDQAFQPVMYFSHLDYGASCGRGR